MTSYYAWPKNAVEIVTEIDEAHGMNWDTESNISILLQFIEEHCDPESFREFVEKCAEMEDPQEERGWEEG